MNVSLDVRIKKLFAIKIMYVEDGVSVGTSRERDKSE